MTEMGPFGLILVLNGLIGLSLAEPCVRHGDCHNTNCTHGWELKCNNRICECVLNACASHPCQNQGNCHMDQHHTTYTCSCQAGFTGTNCEATNICAQKPNVCNDHGTCHPADKSPYYTCGCAAGFSGPTCSIQSCSHSNPCPNGDECTEDKTNHIWHCTPRHTTHSPKTTLAPAPHATTAATHCDSSPCDNGGTCHELVHAPFYRCTCRIGYDHHDCNVHPCDKTICQNGGTCEPTEQHPFYRCNCSQGYTGGHCEASPCHAKPCLHGGTCRVTLKDPFFSCHCASGYAHPNCNHTHCNTGTCLNGATCITSETSPFYQCQCAPGFQADRCQFHIETTTSSYHASSNTTTFAPTTGSTHAPSHTTTPHITTLAPTNGPTHAPSHTTTHVTTHITTLAPTNGPTHAPAHTTTHVPTHTTTLAPTNGPTHAPSHTTTPVTTHITTLAPTNGPTLAPTNGPMPVSTNGPTLAPTNGPMPVSTNGPTSSVTQPHSIVNKTMDNRKFCLACDDAVSPHTCDKITVCGRHESCYVDTYVNSVGSVRFNLGCRDAQQCGVTESGTSKRSEEKLPLNIMASDEDYIGTVVCTQCCNGTLCNAGGCGSEAFPPISPDVRGPVCFKCDQQANIDDCNKIHICGRDEMCEVEAVFSPVDGRQQFWRTQCVHELTCRSTQATQFQQTSNGKPCARACCKEDLCNQSCPG